MDPIKMLADFLAAYDARQIELNSPEIQTGDESPHPWHEEWLALAREAVRSHPFAIGQPVRMADDCPYIGDWRGWTGFVSGIRADNETAKISYEVSDVWPPTDRSGRTDGCYNLTHIIGS